jgi:hypothetical protein
MLLRLRLGYDEYLLLISYDIITLNSQTLKAASDPGAESSYFKLENK